MYDYFDKMLFPSLCEFLDCVDNKRLVAKLFWYKILPAAHNLRYSQGKTGVSLNSVQEWLVDCFWSFSYIYTNQLSYIHSIISTDVWKMWFIKYTVKMDGCYFQQVYDKIWIRFCLNTGKRFFFEVSLSSQQKKHSFF